MIVGHATRQRFAQLFQGRLDAYGTEEGGAHRVKEDGGMVLERHLDGTRPIGVYPIFDHWHFPENDDYPDVNLGSHVRWGCVDFDIKSDHHPAYDYETEDEAHTAAVDLHRVLAALGVTGWIERTRSCGRHVWVFARMPVPAATMRRALLVACTLAEVSTREVNPKSEHLSPEQLGNYVRLPYPGTVQTPGGVTYGSPTRLMLVERAVDWQAYEPYPIDVFAEHAYLSRTQPNVLSEIAEHWTPPPEVEIRVAEPYSGALRTITTDLDGQSYVVFRDGPTTGDRSGGLVYLAHGCARSGLSYDDCFAILLDADSRWGKFSKRADCEKQIGLIASRAYG